MIIPLDLNTNVRLYYNSQSLQSNLAVTFNIWLEDGSVFVSNANGTEIPGSGIYFLDIITPNSNTYLIVKSGVQNDDLAAQVYEVGTSTDKRVFYAPNGLESGRTITYSIYEFDNTVVKSGNLDEINSSGIYYISVNDITTNEELFFQTENHVNNFFVNQGAFVLGEQVLEIESNLTASPNVLYAGQQFISIDSTFVADGTVVSVASNIYPFKTPTSATTGDKRTRVVTGGIKRPTVYTTPSNAKTATSGSNTIAVLRTKDSLILKSRQIATSLVVSNNSVVKSKNINQIKSYKTENNTAKITAKNGVVKIRATGSAKKIIVKK